MVEMKGSTRLLDKVLTDSGSSSVRTLEIYGVNNIDELLNVPMLIKSNFEGTNTATMKVNSLDVKPIKVMKDGNKVDPFEKWVVSGQLYQMIYDGFQFVAFPMGVTSSIDGSYNVLKLDYYAFVSSSTNASNLVEKIGEETLGELFYNIESNADCVYMFENNESNADYKMNDLYTVTSVMHEFTESTGHYIFLSFISGGSIDYITINYRYNEDDSLNIESYEVDSASLFEINRLKYSGVTIQCIMKSGSTYNLSTNKGEKVALEIENNTIFANDLFTLSPDGTYITINQRCLVALRGSFYIDDASAASNRKVYMRVFKNDIQMIDSEFIEVPSSNSTIGYLNDYKYHYVGVGTKISVSINAATSGWNADLNSINFGIQCLSLA